MARRFLTMWGTEERFASVVQTLDQCPNAPAIPCNVVAESTSPFDELGIQMPAPTHSASHTENCMASFQSAAGCVEDTSVFQEDITQLDVAAWGNQVASELEKDTTTTTTGQVNITVDEAVRVTFPGSSVQSNEQHHALDPNLNEQRSDCIRLLTRVT